MPTAFGSAVVEVAIGLAFMYLLLSLIVSVINEFLAQALALRAKTLEEGLVRLLQGTRPAGLTPVKKVLGALKNLRGKSAATHDPPVIREPGSPTPAPGGGKVVPPLRVTATEVLNHPLIVGMTSTSGQQKPSYIPGRTFALVLIDLIAHDLDPTSVNYVADFRDAVDTIQSNPHLKVALLALIDKSTKTAADLRTNIENWFNDAMDRISGWYKRKVSKILFGVGLILAAFVNADSLGVAQSLWTSPTARANVVAAAQDYVSKQPTPAAVPSATPTTFKDQETRLVSQIKDVESSQLPLGWLGWPANPFDWAREILGLLLTAFAVSLGAPFWFDMLGMFVNVRNGGKPPDKTPASTQSGGAAGPTGTLNVTLGTAQTGTDSSGQTQGIDLPG